MSPRIRTFFLLLVLGSLLAAPAAASADPWASIFSVPSACPESGPFATIATDTTTVPVGWQNANVNVALTGANTAGFEWKLSCGGAVQTANPAPITGSGTFTLTHRALESGTGLPTHWVDDTVQIDLTTPVNSTSTSTAWRTGPVTVPLSVYDDISTAHGEWKVDGAVSYTVSGTATVSGTGTHTLYTSAVDSAGNRDDRSQTVKVDNTVPVDTTVTPVGWVQDVAHITLSGTDAGDQSGVASVYYQVDSGAVTPANNGDVIDITANGAHTLKTRVLDNVGNDSGWTTRNVQVDSAGPLDATTGAPVGWYRTAPSVNVSIAATDTSGSGVTRIEWRIPEDALSGDVAGAGPVPVTVTGEGIHTLQVRFTDSQNHVTPWLDHEIKIDTTLPVDVTNPTSAWLSQTSLNVSVHGTDVAPGSGVASVEWKIDGVADSALGDTGTAVVTGTGEHVVESRIIDVAGNASPWGSHTVRLDPSSPRNTSPTASTAWRQGAYSVLLNGEDDNSGVDSVRWKVDNGVEHSGTRAIETATVSGDGVHTLETRVRDVAGNYSTWRPETIRIDSVKPVNTTVAPGAAVGSGHKVTISGTDMLSGMAGVEWQIDNGPIKSTPEATVVGQGAHTLKSRVQDNAGNWSDWLPQSVTVNSTFEDSDAPVDTTTVPTGWQAGAVTVTVSADDQGGTGVKNVEWRLDGLPIDGGANGATFTVSDDGDHEIETRATDFANNTSVWRAQNLKVDRTLPVDTTALPAGWMNTRTFTLKATDATSGVDQLEYKINGGSALRVANNTVVTLPADGTFTVAHRVYDLAGQLSGWKYDTAKVDTVVPVNTSAAAPTAWQTSALSLDLTGTDVGGSGVDHAEWRIGTSGTPIVGSPALVDVDGAALTLQTRIVDLAGNPSVWRSETVKVDRTKPTNTTPAITQGWRKTNFTTTVAGSDATSGVASLQWRLDGGAISSAPAVSITADGMHKLETRVVDVAGNIGDWRPDNIGIDKVLPALAVNCGNVTAWRNTPVDCAVTADGGVSGVGSLTGATGADATAITDGHYVVSADGAWTLTFRAVDGAGNEAVAKADVKVDATAPGANVTCVPDAGLAYTCSPAGADAGSGLAALAYSINGAAPVAVGNGAAFSATKGKVVVTATDGAGNSATSAVVTLADRTPPKTPTTVTPRSTSEAVLLAGKASASGRLLGQLSVSATPTSTTVDLRPLALGKGTFQFVVKVTYGKKTKTVTKTQTTVKGYSKRISVSVPASATAKVDLTVRRKSGKRWVAHAAAHAKL